MVGIINQAIWIGIIGCIIAIRIAYLMYDELNNMELEMHQHTVAKTLCKEKHELINEDKTNLAIVTCKELLTLDNSMFIDEKSNLVFLYEQGTNIFVDTLLIQDIKELKNYTYGDNVKILEDRM